MPSPASPGNLRPNLATIASLAHLEPGAKLSYDIDTGLFSAQETGIWQTVARTFSRDKIESAARFGEPIREIFSAARAQVGNGVTQQELHAALAGLRTLRHSYSDDAEKLAALNAVISDAKIGVRSDSKRTIALREKYATLLVYGFSQGMFIPETSNGVCYAFTLDWARRILGGKASWAHSSKTARPVKPTTSLSPAQKQRIMKKVAGRVGPLHDAFKGFDCTQFGNLARGHDRARYANLLIVSITTVALKIPDGATGSQVIGAALDAAFSDVEKGVNLYLLNLKPKQQGGGGHTIGFRLHPTEGVQFFDSNVGEFRCGWDEFGVMCGLFDEWWELLYYTRGVPDFGSWRLEGVVPRQ